jgi:hypothetical protein
METQSLIYLCGFAFILLFFLLAKVGFSLCSNAWKCCCAACFNSEEQHVLEMLSFSNNIYSELSPEDLKSEYLKTDTEIKDLAMMI